MPETIVNKGRGGFFYYGISVLDQGLCEKPFWKQISNKIISGYERNSVQPSLENLKILCEYYNISADEMLNIQLKKKEQETAVVLNPEQKRLLAYFDCLKEEDRLAVIGMAIVYARDQVRRNTFQ